MLNLERAGGMGMGLAVCREIMARHGGWIHAASRGTGQGSTFRIGLPGGGLDAVQPNTSAAVVQVETA